MQSAMPLVGFYVSKSGFVALSHTKTTMVFRLKRPSHPPSPFSWDSLTAPRSSTPPTEAHVAELPSPPTSWLSARDMKIFGVEPLRSDLGVVRCNDCDKPVLRSAISDHASEFNISVTHKASQIHAPTANCSDIRSGKKWVKSKLADGEGINQSFFALSWINAVSWHTFV